MADDVIASADAAAEQAATAADAAAQVAVHAAEEAEHKAEVAAATVAGTATAAPGDGSAAIHEALGEMRAHLEHISGRLDDLHARHEAPAAPAHHEAPAGDGLPALEEVSVAEAPAAPPEDKTVARRRRVGYKRH